MAFSRNQRIAAMGTVAVGVTLAVLVFAARAGTAKSGTGREDVDVPSPEKLSKVRPALASPPPAAGAPAPAAALDLLDLLRLPEDAIAGEWGFQDRALITPSDRNARVQILCTPPEEYDLNVLVTRKRGVNSLGIGLVVGGRQTMVALDGNDGATSWIFTNPEDHSLNPTTYVGRLLRYNRATRVSCSVRKTGIRVTVDGKTAIDWKGDTNDLYLLPHYLVPHRQSLVFGSWESSFRIDELTLVPVTGAPTLLR